MGNTPQKNRSSHYLKRSSSTPSISTPNVPNLAPPVIERKASFLSLASTQKEMVKKISTVLMKSVFENFLGLTLILKAINESQEDIDRDISNVVLEWLSCMSKQTASINKRLQNSRRSVIAVLQTLKLGMEDSEEAINKEINKIMKIANMDLLPLYKLEFDNDVRKNSLGNLLKELISVLNLDESEIIRTAKIEDRYYVASLKRASNSKLSASRNSSNLPAYLNEKESILGDDSILQNRIKRNSLSNVSSLVKQDLCRITSFMKNGNSSGLFQSDNKNKALKPHILINESQRSRSIYQDSFIVRKNRVQNRSRHNINIALTKNKLRNVLKNNSKIIKTGNPQYLTIVRPNHSVSGYPKFYKFIGCYRKWVFEVV